jgi:hypothetical protein
MFKKILIVVGVLLAGLFAYAAIQPDTFHVERTAAVAAAPERILPLLSDFRRWEAWSPWEKLDPQMKRTFNGAQSGTGAIYEWSGNDEAGAGRMEILSATTQAVDIKLDFLKPFASSNTTKFALQPANAGTQIVWSIDGPMPYLSKLMCVFISMDRLIGKDFETGLRQLKAAAEKPEV